MMVEQVPQLAGNPRWTALAVAVLVSLVPPLAPGAWANPARHEERLTATDRREAIEEICRAVEATYVVRAMRAPIVARLRKAAAQGRYDTDDAAVFAERVTEDLQAVSRDGHLYLKRDPAGFAAMRAPAEEKGLAALRRAQALRQHHGLTELAVLPGNIRYLKITGFKWVPDDSTARTYDAAASFMDDGDARIIDLRGNGGGESDAADYFLKTVLARDVPGPTYLLVDRYVASAAEAVAYDAQLRRRAIIVGAKTYGAANNNKRFAVAPGFVLSVSHNRPVHPLSRTNWEGVGIVPDIASDPLLASETAQLDALKRLGTAAGTTSERLAEYGWRQASLDARLHPVRIADSELRAKAGLYGTIELRHEGEGLRLYRSDRPQWPQGILLQPMRADGLFALEGIDELRVRVTPDVVELLRPGSANPERFSRR